MTKKTRYKGLLKDVMKSNRGHANKHSHLKKLKHKIFGLPQTTLVGLALSTDSVNNFDSLITPESKKIITNGVENFVGLGEEFLLFSLVSYFRKNDIVSRFNTLKDEVEKNLIKGNYKKCTEILNDINRKFGHTFWSIDSYISLKHEIKSPEGIINYIKSITESDNEIDILRILFYKHSSSGLDSFLKNHFHDLQKEYRNNDLPGYIDMLSTLTMPDIYDPDRKIDEIIKVSEILNPLDKYILYKKAFFNYFSKPYKSKNHDLYRRFIDEIYSSTNDSFWIRLKSISDGSKIKQEKTKHEMLVKLYSRGEYDKVIHETSINTGRDLSYIDIKAKSILYKYGKEANPDPSIFCSKLETNIIGQMIILHSDPSIYDSALNVIEELNFRYYTLDLFKSIRPSIYGSYPFINREAYLNACKESYTLGFNITIRHIEKVNSKELSIGSLKKNNNLEFSESRIKRLEFQNLVSDINVSEVFLEKVFSDLLNYSDITKSELEYLRCNMYLRRGNFEKVIDIISESCIEKSFNVILYPLKEVVSVIESEPQNYNSISSLICIYLYYIVRDSSYKVKVSEMLEDFLIDNHSQKPSELFDKEVVLKNKTYEYFFSEICRTEIMSDLLCFDSGKDLLLERLKIVRSIINLQKENLILQEEEKSILGQLLSNKLTVQHEKNKLYIDVEGITKSQLNEYKIKFTSILMIRGLDDAIVEDFFDDVVNEEDSANKVVNARNYIYGNLYEKVVKDFVTDSNVGLARSLSSEIRHGVLPNKLRSVFEGLNLITVTDLDGNYESNEYWCDYLKKLTNNMDLIDFIDNKLKTFSKNVDELIEEANSWPTIAEDRNDKSSMFNFIIDNDKLDKFTRFIDSKLDSLTFEDEENISDIEMINLISIIENYIWDSLEKSFLEIKSRFNEILKAKFSEIISSLVSQIDSTGIKLAKLTEKLSSANVHIIEEISKIEQWFVRPNEVIEGEYLLSDILSSSVESIKAIYHPQVINFVRKDITSSEERRYFNANEALGIVRALISIYQNCLTHGYLHSQTTIFVDSDNLEGVVVRNQISKEIKEHVLENNYVKKVEEFTPKSDYKKLISEGGTGLYKIYRHLVDSSDKFGFFIDLKDNNFLQKVVL